VAKAESDATSGDEKRYSPLLKPLKRAILVTSRPPLWRMSGELE
jgi:hypothetical protein